MKPMRIVIANCSAVYTGRGDTRMEPAVRAIIIKSDGSVSIHQDASNKPLNYMGKGNVFYESVIDELTVWTFDTRNENLTITLLEVISDTSFILAEHDEGLIRDGTEEQLQTWLWNNPEALGEGYQMVGREVQTGNGPVDLLAIDPEGTYVAVEVKRVAMTAAVTQANRYVEALNETEQFGVVRGMIAALDIRPKAVILAEKKNVECCVVPAHWRQG